MENSVAILWKVVLVAPEETFEWVTDGRALGSTLCNKIVNVLGLHADDSAEDSWHRVVNTEWAQVVFELYLEEVTDTVFKVDDINVDWLEELLDV